MANGELSDPLYAWPRALWRPWSVHTPFPMCAILLLSLAQAQTVYRTGLWLLNIQDVDVDGGTFEADFIIKVRDENDTDIVKAASDVRFQNGRRLSRADTLPMGLRIIQLFLFKPRNMRFPFDQNNLEIIYELNLPLAANYSIVWDPMLAGHNKDIKYFGWEFDLSTGNRTIKQSTSFSDVPVPQVRWSTNMRRSQVFGIKMLLPPTVIVFLVLASFTIPLNSSGGNAITRLSVCNSALMSAVFYHANVRSPNTGVLMLFDQYMIVIYSITLVSVAASILILRLSTDKRQTAQNIATIVDKYMSSFVWLLAPMVFVFLFVEWWIALILLPVPSLLLASLFFFWKKFLRTRLRRYTKSDSADDDEDDFESKMLDDVAYDPDLRREVMKNMATTHIDVRTHANPALPKRDGTVMLDPKTTLRAAKSAKVAARSPTQSAVTTQSSSSTSDRQEDTAVPDESSSTTSSWHSSDNYEQNELPD